MAIISHQKRPGNDKKSGKSNFENYIELQPCQSDQGPQCLV